MVLDRSTGPDVGPRESEHQSTTPFTSTLTDCDMEKGLTLPSISPSPPLSSVATPSEENDAQNQYGTNSSTSHVSSRESSSYVGAAFGQTEYVLDVYAKPYVPSGLRAINNQPAEFILHTQAKHEIGFKSYICRFAGGDFLAQHGIRLLDNSLPQITELNEQSYLPYFAPLLRRELKAKMIENEYYALYAVSLQAIFNADHTRLWALSVPGLREDSPLIEMGDTLQIRQLWADMTWTGMQHNAVVHSVSRVQEVVYLRADGLEHLAPYNSQYFLPMVVNVVFPLKERAAQGQRIALLSVSETLKGESNNLGKDWIRRMLFPIESDGRLQTRLKNVPHRALFDHAVNYEQAHAVNSVCANDYGTLPYLISGPPGTGKTKTLVETAMQLLNTTDVAHLLICAPSEAAADTLALRLKRYLTPKQLLRLNAPSRADNEVPRELLQYCFMQEDMFYLPPFKNLMSYSVVVTSCRDGAILAEARLTNADLWSMERELVANLHPEEEPPMPSLHWGALLIDEAAQATEIDVLPAISVVCPPSAYPQDRRQPTLVMAGDEHQLGPRTASNDPLISRSLFARLFTRTLYASHPLSRSRVKPSSGPPVLKRSMLPILYPPFTNLIRNYRSHPAILSVPSLLFYNDTLIPEMVFQDTPLQTSSFWRGRKWPVLYIPHNGPDEIERDNGGWYNISEARLACSITERLVLEDGVKQEDVCIMSPFAAQVKLLRSMIRSNQYAGGSGLWSVNIGPVEAFQGLEKRVVIICTTRTRQRFVSEDVKRSMGLVHQKRKMNVALTRAKEALFVIGYPEILRDDKNWASWMMFCARNGLVEDQYGVWKDKEGFCDGKLSVLERALLARADEMDRKQWPALGAAAADYDIDGEEYEAWAESLRRALDEEENEVHEVEGDDNEDDHHEHDDGEDTEIPISTNGERSNNDA